MRHCWGDSLAQPLLTTALYYSTRNSPGVLQAGWVNKPGCLKFIEVVYCHFFFSLQLPLRFSILAFVLSFFNTVAVFSFLLLFFAAFVLFFFSTIVVVVFLSLCVSVFVCRPPLCCFFHWSFQNKFRAVILVSFWLTVFSSSLFSQKAPS